MILTRWNGNKIWQVVSGFFRNLFRSRQPFYYQLESMDCGPACLKMIAAFHGKRYTLHYLRRICHVSKTGISMQGLVNGANEIGLDALAIKLPFRSADTNSLADIPLPAIAFWDKNHFVVINSISSTSVNIADPAQGKITVSHNRFKSQWADEADQEGVVLLLQPTDKFYEHKVAPEKKPVSAIRFICKYLGSYKKYIGLLLGTLLLVSLINYLFPFLTRSIIDTGIAQRQLNFIYLVLIAQLLLYTFQTSLGFLQTWIVLHISARLTILLSSDFLFKLTRLPISFYDNRAFGEIIQRINDHRRLDNFLSASTINAIFSVFSLFVFAFILFQYNPFIFFIFLSGTALYLSWIFLFLKKRKRIDYELFNEASANNEMLYEFIYGMQEIKLQNSERKRSLKWTKAQERLFRINIKSAALIQFQDGGAFFINQFKDIIITITASALVINGKMSLGMLLATQLIVGLLNAPVQQLVSFIRTSFDAKLCLDRIVEIHGKEEEYYGTGDQPYKKVPLQDIVISNISYRYNALNNDVLKDISLTLPRGKITAIVGASGSGKTTLVKLLLGFYKPDQGSIQIGSTVLSQIPSELWRQSCGAVLQDGYIFSDTIANNISESDEVFNQEKFDNAVFVSNIRDYIDSLALKANTMIGSKGNGLSQGQKQRVLIARAVYKNPDYLFFDEATNALDTRNEHIIMDNLDNFYKGKTVVIVAHRLSTVCNADQIVVLDEGMIAEQGTHHELVEKQGIYFQLIKNQLELSS